MLLFCREQLKTTRKSEFVELGLRIVSLSVFILTLWLLFHYLIIGTISIYVFAVVFITIDQLFNYSDYIGYSIGDISRKSPVVQNTMRFLHMPERQGLNVKITNHYIRFMNVSYRYPNMKKNSIENLNFEINIGETVAIVGENGAGKSTVVKLLTGLYLPTEGIICIDGKDTQEISPKSIYCGISAVFQKFQKYKMNLRDNIIISETNVAINEEKIKQSLDKSNFNFEMLNFTDGLDTMLSREFDGIDLSGGQWQRVAIGRSFYRNHKMIILDEPTSSIDPIEETRIYKQFVSLSKNKTAIIVTHRLGSAKLADRIIVMKQGRIDDIGCHDQLMQRKGLYHDMYIAQAKWYK